MEFFIKRNATLPLLKMQVVKDGRSDYNKMFDMIEESAIFFSMIDTDTGIPRINTRPAGFVNKKLLDPNATPEYYVYYQFSGNDTSKTGRYEGQFLLRNDDGVLILPIREKLYINIQESFIADNLEYESCYVVDFPCCVYVPPTPIPSTTTTTTTTIPPVSSVTFTLFASYTPGSINVNYILSASENVPYDYTVNFSNLLSTYTGNTIEIVTGITVTSGENLVETSVVLNDEDFTNLTGEIVFENITVSTTGTPFNFEFIGIPLVPAVTTTTTTSEPIYALLISPQTYFDLSDNP